MEQFSICSGDSIWGDEERATGLIYDHHHMMLHMDSSSPPIPSSDYNGYHGSSGVNASAYSNSEYYERYNDQLVGTKRNIDASIIDECDREKTRQLYDNYYTAGPSDGVMIEHSYSPKQALTNAQEQCFQVNQKALQIFSF